MNLETATRSGRQNEAPAEEEPDMPQRSQSRAGKKRGGFTILELLVAMAVLALLVAMVAQLTDSTSAMTTGSRRRMNADAQARVVFDRMASDLSGMVMRPDLDAICKGLSTASGPILMTEANDALYFLSRAPGFFDSQSLSAAQKSDLALVGYRINSDPANSHFGQLERLGKGLTWEGQPSASGTANGIAFLPSVSGTVDLSGAPGSVSAYLGSNGMASIGTASGNFADGVDGDFHLLGGVYRMEYGYLLKPFTDASGVFHPARYSSIPYYGDSVLQGHNSLKGWQDVAAIVVTLAILDKESRKTLRSNSSAGTLDPTLMKSMQGALPDFAENASCLKAWQAAVGSPAFAAASGNIPAAAASQVRVYQRCFYLNK